MKNLLFLLGVLFSTQLFAQQKPTDLDKSPLDVSYYPANFPILKMRGQASGDPAARIIYSRPQLKGRNIFGEEVKYNEVWRLGANEATELELFKNAVIGGKKIPKGRYTLYCIPTENKWTIIINKDNYSWGSFTYKSDKDVARIDVPIQKNSEQVEALTIYFENASIAILWDNVKVNVPISF
jgi:hypothetical protein